MDFWQAVATGFKKYVIFSGRAVRSEYWYWTLFWTIAGLATLTIDIAMFGLDSDTRSISGAFDLVTFLPSLAVWIRRLHDIDRTGWWILIGFTIIGIIPLFIWACTKGTPGYNRFGVNPLPALLSRRQAA